MQALAYDQLSSTLAIQTVRELEDLIIESVYLGLVSGKLNQAKKVFEVAEVSGRDVRASDIAQMLDILTTWQSTSATVMENIHKRIVAADDDNKVAAIKKTSREASIQDKFQTVRIALESDPDGYASF
jgi:COP9 signalosome complex subunit 7